MAASRDPLHGAGRGVVVGRDGRARRARAAVRLGIRRAAGRAQLARARRADPRPSGRFIIDHTANSSSPCRLDPAFKALLGLLDTGRCWVKLSAPYETSKKGAPRYEDVGALAKELVRAAPERMLWASNWPHPSVPKEKRPDDADLLDLLLEWAPDDATRRKILVENPAELYD
jgi:predicted TIM-barrel fold metal-dependent hydrolase